MPSCWWSTRAVPWTAVTWPRSWACRWRPCWRWTLRSPGPSTPASSPPGCPGRLERSLRGLSLNGPGLAWSPWCAVGSGPGPGPVQDPVAQLVRLLEQEAPLLAPGEAVRRARPSGGGPGRAGSHPGAAGPARRDRRAGERARRGVGGGGRSAEPRRRGAGPRRHRPGDRAVGRTARAAGRPRPSGGRRAAGRRHPGRPRSCRRWRWTVRLVAVRRHRSTAVPLDELAGAGPAAALRARVAERRNVRGVRRRRGRARPPCSTRWRPSCRGTSGSSPSRTSPSCGCPATTWCAWRPAPARRRASDGWPSGTWCGLALRLRPDRIVVGEVRGAEAADMVWAMSTGHRGCMSTVHASTATDALARLEHMAVAAGDGVPMDAVRSAGPRRGARPGGHGPGPGRPPVRGHRPRRGGGPGRHGGAGVVIGPVLAVVAAGCGLRWWRRRSAGAARA